MDEYRYLLHRTCSPTAGRRQVVWVMLNPSTADDQRDDPTIRRCTGFSARAGAAALTVVNLYALRSTRPAGLWGHPDPVGPENDGTLAAVLADAAAGGWPVICAWGIGDRSGRSRDVVRLAHAAGVTLLTLGLTRDGHPRHPLYVPASLVPQTFTPCSPTSPADPRARNSDGLLQ